MSEQADRRCFNGMGMYRDLEEGRCMETINLQRNIENGRENREQLTPV
ncbi:MAG: hypothetical protein KDA79_21915 [Planctomycetaceae bacterium]|nr:hypothetical protein [Planctomycetaceae bacterium]